MGVACGDLDGDGLPDLAVTNFFGESTTLYRNLGGGVFGDQTAASGLAAASRSLLGFGIAFARLTTTTAGSTWPPPTATSTTSARPSPTRCPPSSWPARGGPPGRRLRVRRPPLDDPPRRPGAGRRRPRQRRPARPPDRLPGRAPGLFPQPDRGRALPHPPPRRDRLQPRRRRRPGDGHVRGPSPGRPARRGRAATSPPPILASTSGSAGPTGSRRSRSPGRRGGSIAIATCRPMPATCSAKDRPRRHPWEGSRGRRGENRGSPLDDDPRRDGIGAHAGRNREARRMMAWRRGGDRGSPIRTAISFQGMESCSRSWLSSSSGHSSWS